MANTILSPAGLQHVLRLQLRPHEDMHPSWLPPAWPSHWRRWRTLGPAGQAVLASWLRGSLPDLDYRFDSPCKRLLLMDSRSLRRLSLYCGLALHARLMSDRDALGAQLRRQARRIDDDAVDFVMHRLPPPSAFRIDPTPLRERPISAGRVVVDRGYRLLQAAVAGEGEAVLKRVQRKLPRRAAALRPLSLQPHQLAQLDELMLMCIVPERLPQWDWLT
ncbi:SctK family type III secretion system sorting platform protein [Aquincola sp. S2]|uniref:SctK family type III secretion system sorting platform protein n=1 Tax=Pseudaquabacterium terrae TaxID=2732868 RepID=A0ABX2ELD3_9BURK|nr:SctK family type III secretion system sorting platform protein [Aquabacterium terrae]NRF69413.1 SctK family type III secretion system sorting platform protein [Aquabacterium terrae]